MFEERNFFLRQEFERAIFGLFFQCLQAFYALFDGLEVGEHTAEPAFVDEVLVAAFCFVFNGFLGLFSCLRRGLCRLQQPGRGQNCKLRPFS